MKDRRELELIASKEKPEEGLEDFVKEFHSDRTNEVEKIKMFISKGDYEAVSNLAHKWKGYSAPYGFSYLGELAIKIEESVRLDKTNKLEALLAEVEVYLDLKIKQ